MPISTAEKRAKFRELHRQGCFVIPNPWNIGGVRRLEKLGFQAIASTSAGYATSLGREDGELSCDEVLDHLRNLCESTDLPVNADFEAGFADDSQGVATNVSRAIDTGIAGLSIEDRAGPQLFPLPIAIERIKAARQAIDHSSQDVLLVGRSEGFLLPNPNLDDTIQRLIAYANAGADCLYAPGVTELAAVKSIVQAVAPKPVNVLLFDPGQSVAELAAIGVRRISVGSSFAKAAWAAFDSAALSVRDHGRLPS